MIVQRLCRLRDAYPALLKLGCDNRSYTRHVLSKLLRHERSTSTVARIDPEKVRRSTIPDPDTTNENDVDENGPDKVQENVYAHNFFLNSQKYADTVLKPKTAYALVTNKEALKILNQDWSSMTSAEMVSSIKKLSYNISHSNEKIEHVMYAKVFDTMNMQNLTNDDLIIMMQHLVPFNSYIKNCSFYNNFYNRINRECLIRFLRLPREKMLYICDILYQLKPQNFYGKSFLYNSQYIWYAIRNLGNKPHKLNPQQLVQLLFFLNICRKPPVNMYELEYQLEQHIDELSINELAIAALGFFKTSTKIRNKHFLKYIINKTIKEIDMVDSVSIAAIVKLVRYSMTLIELGIFPELLRALTPCEPRYTLQSLAHIAQACGRIGWYNKELMDRIIGRLNKELKTARIKDFERFLYAFSMLNIDSSNSVYQNIIEELRATWNTTRALEIAKHSVIPARILGYLAIQNIYPIDLIKHVMAPEYVNKTCFGNYHFLSREYALLDYSLRVEVPEYDGPFLKPNVCSFIEKKYYEMALKSSKGETQANVLFTDVLQTCQELFNTATDILVTRTLPYIVIEDIIFCIDEQNRLVPSEKFLSQFKSNDIKYVSRENSNNRWIALIMGYPGSLIRSCFTPTGPLAAKIRQLSIIGYTPIVIPHIPWSACKSSQKKCDYIKKLVFQDNRLK